MKSADRAGRGRPQILAILNGSPDSFSSHFDARTPDSAAALRLIDDGADIIDIGGQSLRTDQPEVSAAVEAERAARLMDFVRVSRALDTRISIDTYRAEVLSSLDIAGVVMVNDPSRGSDPALDRICVERGLDLVMTYNIAPPKKRLDARDYVLDPVQDCIDVLARRIDRFVSFGGTPEKVLIDPGVDLGKSPAQSVCVLKEIPTIRRRLGIARVLWALSRKDFIGSITGRRPIDRDAGTLAALSAVTIGEDDVIRTHDVDGVRDFLLVREAFREADTPLGELDPALRYNT